MLYALLAIAVALTWVMFQTRNMMLGFPCVMFWAIMGGYCYTMSVYDWDTWYFLFFASFGMAIFCALAMYALRTPKEEKKEGDEYIDEGKDETRYIDEGKPTESDNPERSEVSERTRKLRARADNRRSGKSRRTRL